jgi:hypothetical protein
MRPDLIAWQWQGYPTFHRNRLNLAIHLFAVPAFDLGVAWAMLSLLRGAWWSTALGVFVAFAAFAAQAWGHSREENPAIPFDGPVDALSRIAVEQGFTFWRYVLTGRWWAAARG